MCELCKDIPNKREDLKLYQRIYFYVPMEEFMLTPRPYNNGNRLSHERDLFINYCPECGRKLTKK